MRASSADTRSRPILPRRVAIAATLAWALLSFAALMAGDPAGVARSGGALLIVVLAVALAPLPAFRRASVVVLGVYAAGLTLATLAAGAGLLGGGDARVQILTGNPNFLAAALVTAFTAWAAVAPRRRLVWWGWPVVALAVLHTGSRTAGGALLAAATLWIVVQAVRSRPRLMLAPLVGVLVLAAAAFAWQRGVVELTPNLLAAPSDLDHAAWRHDLALHVRVVDTDVPGPFPGTTAQRLVAQAQPGGRNLVHQSIGRSEEGVPYVASIHLRADAPGRLVLTSHLASTTCDVGIAWSRCVTPVGYGDDVRQRQFHLRAQDRGGSVDVYVFGAQYERGTAVTAFRDARPAWVPQTMVNRYDLRRITFLPADRVALWRTGLELAREHPWFGLGLPGSQEAFRERSAAYLSSQGVTYAHNLAVHLLAVHGAIGSLGAALFAVALLASLSTLGWMRLAPMLVALALLNTWDVTFFDPSVLLAATIATAYWTAAPPKP